jgi:hypothetical protein
VYQGTSERIVKTVPVDVALLHYTSAYCDTSRTTMLVPSENGSLAYSTVDQYRPFSMVRNKHAGLRRALTERRVFEPQLKNEHKQTTTVEDRRID